MSEGRLMKKQLRVGLRFEKKQNKTQQDWYICSKKLVKEMRINCHSSLYIHLATYTPSGHKLMSWGSSSMEFQKV